MEPLLPAMVPGLEEKKSILKQLKGKIKQSNKYNLNSSSIWEFMGLNNSGEFAQVPSYA